MRYITLILALVLLPGGVFGQPSVSGISVGDSFPEAEAQLMEKCGEVNDRSDEYGYIAGCKAQGRMYTITASKENYESKSEAKVEEVSLNLGAMDASERAVARTYNRYRERWKEKLGDTEPLRNDFLTRWRWTTDSLRAIIRFQELSGNPYTIDISLRRQ